VGVLTADRLIAQHLAAGPRLVDHHCHGLVTADLDRAGFEALISEAGPPPPGASNFDTPVGLAIRRHCAPVLDLPRHASPEDYLARRRELGAAEVNRRFLAASGTAEFCVDTGFRSGGLTSPGQLAALAGDGARGHEIVRLESVAEALAAEIVGERIAGGVTAGWRRAGTAGAGTADGAEFADQLVARIEQAVTGSAAVGVKTIAAYRVGLDLYPEPPDRQQISRAADAWLRRGPRPGRGDRADEERGNWRLDDAVLTRALWWAAVELGLPIQFHIGFGDADIRMSRTDPTLLTDWLHRHRTPVMLLHCWPYHRQASYLAAVHPHVHLDVGLALHFVGPSRARAVLDEATELAPFGKLLYSSDAFGVAEFYHLAALSFRSALSGLLTDRVTSGEWSATDATRIADLIGHGNAQRIYRLAPTSP
jgi:hypothetical protein